MLENLTPDRWLLKLKHCAMGYSYRYRHRDVLVFFVEALISVGSGLSFLSTPKISPGL